MNFGEILTADCANGEGMRVSLFVSGCTNHCKGCFNEKTWDFSYGRPYTPAVENYLMGELSFPYYEGLTILGGEPFEFENQPAIARLVERVSKELPQKTIWIYTGFVYEKDLLPGGRRHAKDTDTILDRIDVLVDGPYVESLRNIRLRFRGSENQRILDMKKTRQSHEICLLYT